MQTKSQYVGKTQVNAPTQSAMTPAQRIKHIQTWLKQYARNAKIQCFVVGISGGIDSSVVSALCARTGILTMAVQMPIRQNRTLNNRSSLQAGWLLERYKNVEHINMDLTPVFTAFERRLGSLCGSSDNYDLAMANSRARLRMMTLYQIAQSHSGIVVGTGNRVEDFGVGFFTKYGDGGVDISPIGDCMKTQVWDMGRELGLEQEIIDAAPTDGLWDDGRTDEGQLGLSYQELEQAMVMDTWDHDDLQSRSMSAKDKRMLKTYRQIRARNLHKMLPIPVCKQPDSVL